MSKYPGTKFLDAEVHFWISGEFLKVFISYTAEKYLEVVNEENRVTITT